MKAWEAVNGGVRWLTVVVWMGASLCLWGGDADSPSDGEEGDTKEEAAASKPKAKGKGKDSKIKSYDEVIPEDAETKVGLFRVHRIEDKLFYEILPDVMGTDLLWVTQIARTTAGSSYAGMPVGDGVVRWEQRGERILLRRVRYSIRAETDDPISRAVEASNLAPIIQAFDVQAYGKDRAPVIDVTELFTKDVPEFSAKNSLGVGGMDAKRSFIESFKVFPENINVEVLATYAPKGGGDGDGGGRSSGVTAVIHHSMVRLPDRPMKPRRHDSRVGFFSVGFSDYADDVNHEVPEVRHITRWRLEKRDLEAELSEPVKPIVFYVGRGTPEKWKPYVKAGIEQWQPAFEAAGFKNAIIGKYAPDPREDPDWDAEDARISTIRWLPSGVENAFGPHVHDPRTGEILEADVRMYHNVQKLVRDWYFVQASPSDPRAQKLPLPDDLVGELIQFVVAHEVGHSIGFPHNMKASSAYTVEQLRDPEWTRKNGTAPSIMDYARFNYVAQPGDGAALLPQIGPYDHFAVNWGYRQFPDDVDEKAALEEIVKKQINEPMLRFGGRNPSLDSTAQTEDLGSNAVDATRLGMKNLERVSDTLVRATSEPGEDYRQLENMYGELIAQWNREMGHVVSVVGGVEQINLYFGDADQRYFLNDTEYQEQALSFLIEEGLNTPSILVREDVLKRIAAEGVADKVLDAQRRVVTGLISNRRIQRMSEYAARVEGETLTPARMIQRLVDGIFSEWSADVPSVDLYRRNLQRATVDHLVGAMKSLDAGSDLPGLARHELQRLSRLLSNAGRLDVRALEAHRGDLLGRIRRAFEDEGDR